jgi:hypothetical protein
MQKFCGYCGSPLKEGQKFCGGCGHPVPQPKQPINPVQNAQRPVNQQSPRPASQQSPKPSSQQPSRSSNQTPVQPKKSGCGKALLVIAIIAVVIVGAVKLFQKPDKPKLSQNTSSTKSPKNTSSEKPSSKAKDERPPIVLDGKDYQLELPASAKDVKCEPVTEKRLAQLKKQGYKFISTPLNVTFNGEEHVQLDGVATVSIDIPKDYPKDKYMDLVGVLITDKGPVYRIPDYYALREGVVRFETSHFCEAGAVEDKQKLRERFIDNVAVNGWQRNMDNKKLEPTWKEQLTKFANDHCLGENDLAGIAARELFADNDIVKIGMDIVNAHDMENASLEQRLEVASENMVKMAEAKMLSYFLDKLKEEDTKKKKVLDELKSEKKGEFVYKTEIEKIDSRRNKIIDVLKDRFSIDNVEKVSSQLGEGPSLEKCFVYACDHITDYAKDKLKSKAIELLPYIKTVQATAKAVEIGKKFWAATQMKDLYEKFEEAADERGGVVDQDRWTLISRKLSAPEFLHGMSDAEIKAMFEERYRNKVEINKRKEELRKMLDLIETTVDLNSDCLEKKHFDYVQRLTIVNNLMDRFRSELLNKDGALVYSDDGYRRVLTNSHMINEQLCFVINKYFECYPDQEKFYMWLTKNGYNYGQLKQDYDKLDALLWVEKEEKPKYDPEINIVIMETLGDKSGGAKYVGHTICLGTNNKPYLGWHINVPNDDELFDLGWQAEFPSDDSNPVTLSRYKSMGMPNQVLVYKNENDFQSGKQPIAAIGFVVDTTGATMEVELNQTRPDYVFKSFEGIGLYGQQCDAEALNNAVIDAFSKTGIQLQKNGAFSLSTQGHCDRYQCYNSDNYCNSQANVTLSGNYDKKTGNGTFTLSVSGSYHWTNGFSNSASYKSNGKIVKYSEKGKNYLLFDGGTAPLYIKHGKGAEDVSLSGIKITFQAFD